MNILKKSCLQECAKKWVAITAGTLLCCIYFSYLRVLPIEEDGVAKKAEE